MPALLLAMLMIDSLHYVFGRLFRGVVPPTTASFYVLAIASAEIFIFLLLTKRLNWQMFKQNLLFFVSIGLLVSLATILSYTAVVYIDAATASLLARLATVFGLAFGVFWLHEKLTNVEWLGAILCIIGAVVISFQPGDIFQLGSLLVVASTLAYSLHTAIIKRYGNDLEFVNFFFFRVATTTFFVFFFTIPTGGFAVPEAKTWLYFLLAGTVDVVISRTLYYWALRKMRLGIHTLLLTVSPVITILWGFFLFQELPTKQAILGGMIVLSGIVAIGIARLRGAKA